MKQEIKNPYIDKEYKEYQDERWTSIPKVDVLKVKSKLSKEQLQKAKEFEQFIENIIKEDTKKEK